GRGARDRARAPAARPARPRGQGRLRDRLPHGHRGHARADGVPLLIDFLERRELLPGFVDGYSRIAADEQRHIAYGTEFLRRAVAEDAAMAEAIRSQLRSLLPAVAEAVSPPREGAFDALGVNDGALAQFGLDALTRRLAI